jgi:radical SAM protein with 4Fe4S-binding SPASM domain
MLNGLSQINVELTSKCDRHTLCGFCGHQDADINKNTKGDIDFDLLVGIKIQLPWNIVVQFHRDGEPTAYPRLREALLLFRHHITSIVTHGENLIKKADEIIDNCTSLTVSAFNGDPDMDLQVENVKEFLARKGDKPPMVNIKIVGFMSPERESVYASLGVPIIRRLLHVPHGNYRYIKRAPTVPEHGICLDFLSHPSIDWRGNVYVCNRLDTGDRGLIGNLADSSLDGLWNGEKRMNWLDAHKIGRRDLAAPLCKTCVFYGVPSEQ